MPISLTILLPFYCPLFITPCIPNSFRLITFLIVQTICSMQMATNCPNDTDEIRKRHPAKSVIGCTYLRHCPQFAQAIHLKNKLAESDETFLPSSSLFQIVQKVAYSPFHLEQTGLFPNMDLTVYYLMDIDCDGCMKIFNLHPVNFATIGKDKEKKVKRR